MRPNHVRTVLVLSPILLLIAFCAQAEDKKPTPVKDWSKATSYRVLRAIDGDTIEIEKDGKPLKVW